MSIKKKLVPTAYPMNMKKNFTYLKKRFIFKISQHHRLVYEYTI